MCGRYVSVSTPEQLAEAFGIDEVKTESLGERYNVAPSLDVYAVLGDAASRRLGTLVWGFVPWFAKDRKRAPINARAETVATNGMFKQSFAERRCLLPADGFYEWQKPQREGERKQPWYLHRPGGEPLAFAGIWSTWRDREAGDAAEPLHSTAIVTTAAQGEIERIHGRMPVILPERLWDAWLDPATDVDTLARILANVGPPDLVAEQVGELVNNVRNDGPELLAPPA